MRVLVIEDDARIGSFVSKGLRENSYAVDLATDGNVALYQLAISDYDAVILDVMLPGLDGLQVCREMRAQGNRTPVLMLTARDTIDDKITGLDIGADDYLTKPFAFKELLARLRALLRRPSRLAGSSIVVLNLEINTNSRRVQRNGIEVSLTAKEYALLEFLAREKGNVVGRAAIAEHVWDENFDPFSNLIEVYIKRLRKKIDDGFERPLIHTRRGAGYVLDDV